MKCNCLENPNCRTAQHDIISLEWRRHTHTHTHTHPHPHPHIYIYICIHKHAKHTRPIGVKRVLKSLTRVRRGARRTEAARAEQREVHTATERRAGPGGKSGSGRGADTARGHAACVRLCVRACVRVRARASGPPSPNTTQAGQGRSTRVGVSAIHSNA